MSKAISGRSTKVGRGTSWLGWSRWCGVWIVDWGSRPGLKCGAPEGIRTPDLCLRRAALYPAELRAHRLLTMSANATRSALMNSERCGSTPLGLRPRVQPPAKYAGGASPGESDASAFSGYAQLSYGRIITDDLTERPARIPRFPRRRPRPKNVVTRPVFRRQRGCRYTTPVCAPCSASGRMAASHWPGDCGAPCSTPAARVTWH